jgi:flagellar biosynthesis activator protein FlaF
MHRKFYTEILAEAPASVRANEREALLLLINMLNEAVTRGAASREMREALAMVNSVWSHLLAGIACSDNYLSDETKAAVISIGLFILREVDRVRLGNSASIDIICEVNAAIAEGLA